MLCSLWTYNNNEFCLFGKVFTFVCLSVNSVHWLIRRNVNAHEVQKNTHNCVVRNINIVVATGIKFKSVLD